MTKIQDVIVTKHYLFDVDGTLTPSREKINEEFHTFLVEFFTNNNCSIVTGSDIDKTIEQLGEQLLGLTIFNFNCSGNSITGKQEYHSDWTPSDELIEYLNQLCHTSNFTKKAGNHIEKRTGSLNFSIVGRPANKYERELYIKHDNYHNERKRLSSLINAKFTDIMAVVGGETGLDIFEKNKDKRQVLEYIGEDESIFFYGDMMEEGGNDYSLMDEIRKKERGVSYNVGSWIQTYELLKRRRQC